MSEFKELQDLLTDQKKMLKLVKNELRRAPDGTLLIQMSRGRPVFLRVKMSGPDRIRQGIGRKPALVSALAHKAYLKELKRRLESNIDALSSTLNMCESLDQNDVLSNMPAHFDLIDPKSVIYGYAGRSFDWPVPVRMGVYPAVIATHTEMRPDEWAAKPYLENTIGLEGKIQVAPRGFCCRSKSELAILEIYEELGIFYHYDEVVRCGSRLISPDFIGCRNDGMLIYHEHLGSLSSDYRSSYRQKEELYASFGIITGRNLIYTYDDERGRLNLRLAREIIRDAYRI